MTDPRPGRLVRFGYEDVSRHRERYPDSRCIHRINRNDLSKGTAGTDQLLARANAVADHTIFVSAWLRDYHASRWFDIRRPHSVILNGADPAVFYPTSTVDLRPNAALRLVTHHWSDNWMKGFDAYQEIDRRIADGSLPGVELWVIGRWPVGVSWKAAKTFPPMRGRRLAGLLRQCDAYVTAARWESGPMHVAEAAQCGLPILYHPEGGGGVEMAAPFGVKLGDDILRAISELRERFPMLRQQVLSKAPCGDQMCAAYRTVLQAHLNYNRLASS